MRADLQTLMVKAQTGDKDAYRRLMQAIVPKLKKYFAKKITGDSDVEDMVQTTLMAVHQNRQSYNSEQPFENWLYGIARYKMMDFFRQTYRERDVLSFDTEKIETFHGVDTNDSREARQDLEKLMENLPDRQRKIVYLVKIKGESIADVAVKMGMTPSNVKVTCHRAMELMKGMVGQHG